MCLLEVSVLQSRFSTSRLFAVLWLLLFVSSFSPVTGGFAAYAQSRPDSTNPTTPRVLPVPEDDVGAATLEARGRGQRKAAESYEVFHGFRFGDRLEASGITFTHHIVDDAGKHYKPVHYDHGNGLAAADVDGDGRTDLYFLSQLGPNELWRNLGGGRFENITARAGVALDDRVSVTASFGDLDNDGDPDLFVTTVRMGNVLFENLGEGRFRDVSKEAGVDYVGHSSGAVLFDYNRDGRLDLFVANVGVYTEADARGRGGAHVGLDAAFRGHLYPERTETSLLYENLGGLEFREVSRDLQLVNGSWSGDATFTDFDGDLWPDLYVLNMQGDDTYWQNQEGRTFADRTRELFPRTPWGAMGVRFFDWNNDGHLDLFVTDMHSDMLPEVPLPHEETRKSQWDPDDRVFQGGRDNVFGNAFYENRGDGTFAEVSDAVGAENFWPWGLSTGDLNADGYEDAFIASSMNFPFRYGVSSVLLNEGGERWREAEFVLGVEPRSVGTDTKVPWFELDCSGTDSGHTLCRGRSGRWTVTANLGSRSSVIFDLDGDGDLDIVTNEFNSPPRVLVSDLAQRSEVRFLEIELVGSVSNRDGLGARVTVKAGDRTFTRFHDGKSGYLSQSSMPLYFGLGKAETVDEIEVRWPSGLVQKVTAGIRANTRMRLTEPLVTSLNPKPNGNGKKESETRKAL